MFGTGNHFFPRSFRQSILNKSNPTHTTIALYSAQLSNNKEKQDIDINNNNFRNYKKRQLKNILKSCQQKASSEPKILTTSKGKQHKKYLCVKGFQKQPLLQLQQQRKKVKRKTESSISTNRVLYKHKANFCWNSKLIDKPKTVEVRFRRHQSKEINQFKGWDTIDDDFDLLH